MLREPITVLQPLHGAQSARPLGGNERTMSQGMSSYQEMFQLERFFAGRLKVWGVFQDRFGSVRRKFEADAQGIWDGATLTLLENFTYEDGQTEQRTWRIDKVGDTRYRGRADDVVGLAEGEVRDNALNWSYLFTLVVGGRSYTVRFNEWLFLQSDGILLNRTEVTKFGLRIGQVVSVFSRLPDMRDLGELEHRAAIGS